MSVPTNYVPSERHAQLNPRRVARHAPYTLSHRPRDHQVPVDAARVMLPMPTIDFTPPETPAQQIDIPFSIESHHLTGYQKDLRVIGVNPGMTLRASVPTGPSDTERFVHVTLPTNDLQQDLSTYELNREAFDGPRGTPKFIRIIQNATILVAEYEDGKQVEWRSTKHSVPKPIAGQVIAGLPPASGPQRTQRVAEPAASNKDQAAASAQGCHRPHCTECAKTRS
ncbi:hypothetical protein FA95DRAFT_1554990 [Auriscalpium vulgare]|uniref:Uncharacterized protein n=1 Tax=Auriscalpium vulgare TaxID=40419 RepID=A0ACB8S395_9AGAM|nr:hypothetical protein FA95DRAFT_1554990 [Auriscalpium vulgare]